MSTKAIKISIAALLVLGAAYAVWPRGTDVAPPSIEASGPAASARPSAEPAQTPPVTKTEAGTVADADRSAGPKDEPPAISLVPARGSIVGVVTDDTGAPIPGATVRALRFPPGSVQLKELLATKSDPAGRYVLKPIETRCVVEANDPDRYAERKLASPFTRVDFSLGRPGILQGAVIRVRDESPVVNATVAVYFWQPYDASDQLEFNYTWRRPPTATTRTNESGGYGFGKLRPGGYQLRVVPVNGPQIHTRHERLEVRSGEVTVKDLVLPGGIKLVGKVTVAETEEPIAGAEVFVMPNAYRFAVTDANGRYEIPDFERSPPFGKWIGARAKGYYPDGLPSVGWNAFTDEAVLNVTMKPGGVVRGRVVGPDGPVAGASVSVSPRVLQTTDDSAITPTTTATSDENGRFELTVPADAGRPVYAVKRGLAWGASEPVGVGEGEVKSGVAIRMTRGGTIRGRVTDVEGNAIDAAAVGLWQGHWGRTRVHTRPDGRYEIEAVRAGTYELKVTPPGVLARGRSPLSGVIYAPVTVTENGLTEVDMSLSRGPVINGRVVDPSGRPIPDVVVRANVKWVGYAWSVCLSPPHDRIALSDQDGRFRLEGLWTVEKLYWLTAHKPGYEKGYLEKVAPDGTDVLFTLMQYKKLTGRVVYASGKPAREFWVWPSRIPAPGEKPKPRRGRAYRDVEFPAPNRLGRFCDLDGRFTALVKPGRYHVRAQTDDGQRSDRQSTEVPAVGEPPALELRVWPGAFLRGTVETPEGNPPRHANVSVFDLGARPPKSAGSASTDLQGEFRIRALRSGTYLVHVEAGRADARTGAAERVTLQVGAETRVDLTLEPGVDVAVAVVGPDHEPLEGARVTVQRADGAPVALRLSRTRLVTAWLREQQRTRRFSTHQEVVEAQKRELRKLSITGRDGRLAPWLLIPGEYGIEATAAGHAVWRKTIRVTAGAKKAVRIVLEKE